MGGSRCDATNDHLSPAPDICRRRVATKSGGRPPGVSGRDRRSGMTVRSPAHGLPKRWRKAGAMTRSIRCSMARSVHAHPDHPLDVVLDRFAQSGGVLPIVSRANAHQVEGAIALDDITRWVQRRPSAPACELTSAPRPQVDARATSIVTSIPRIESSVLADREWSTSRGIEPPRDLGEQRSCGTHVRRPYLIEGQPDAAFNRTRRRSRILDGPRLEQQARSPTITRIALSLQQAARNEPAQNPRHACSGVVAQYARPRPPTVREIDRRPARPAAGVR